MTSPILRCVHFRAQMHCSFTCCPGCHEGKHVELQAPPKSGWQFLASSTTARVCCVMRANLAGAGREVWARALREARRHRVRPTAARKSASVGGSLAGTSPAPDGAGV